jgi:hypothetical protein
MKKRKKKLQNHMQAHAFWVCTIPKGTKPPKNEFHDLVARYRSKNVTHTKNVYHLLFDETPKVSQVKPDDPHWPVFLVSPWLTKKLQIKNRDRADNVAWHSLAVGWSSTSDQKILSKAVINDLYCFSDVVVVLVARNSHKLVVVVIVVVAFVVAVVAVVVDKLEVVVDMLVVDSPPTIKIINPHIVSQETHHSYLLLKL